MIYNQLINLYLFFIHILLPSICLFHFFRRRKQILLEQCGSTRVSIIIMLLDINQTYKQKIFQTCVFWGKKAFRKEILCSYKIEDLEIERQFRVSATLKACFESADDDLCLVNLDIFKDTLLPKRICDWTQGFSTASMNRIR